MTTVIQYTETDRAIRDADKLTAYIIKQSVAAVADPYTPTLMGSTAPPIVVVIGLSLDVIKQVCGDTLGQVLP